MFKCQHHLRRKNFNLIIIGSLQGTRGEEFCHDNTGSAAITGISKIPINAHLPRGRATKLGRVSGGRRILSHGRQFVPASVSVVDFLALV